MKIKLQKVECKKCGYRWIPRKEEIRLCPKCKSPWFDMPKSNNRQKD